MASPDTLSATAFEWSRFVKALAASPDVDLDTLYGLMLSNRNLSGNLSKEAIEVLALRCLEALFDPAKVLSVRKGHSSWSANQKEFRADSSESAVRVLQLAMEQTNLKKSGLYQLENLRKGATEALVRNVQAFVQHKKTQLPKSAIEQQVGGISVTALKAQNTSTDKEEKQLEEKSAPVSIDGDELPDGEGAGASTHQNSTPINIASDGEGVVASMQRNSTPINVASDGEGVIAFTQRNSTPINVDSDEQPDLGASKTMHSKETSHGCPQLDVCMKCKEGGEVLACNTRFCQIKVHESCLGFKPRLDNNGTFLCPVCAYSRAISECAEAEKKMLLATEKKSLFHRANPTIQGRDMDKGVEVIPTGTTTKDREPVGPTIPNEDISSKQKGASPIDRASKDQLQEGHLALAIAENASNPSSKVGEGEAERHVKGKQGMQTEKLDDAGLHGGNPKQHPPVPSKNASLASSRDTTGTKDVKYVNGKQKIQTEDGDDAGSHEGNSRQQTYVPSKNASCASSGDSTPTKNVRHVKGNQKIQTQDSDDAASLGSNSKQLSHGPSKNASCASSGDTTGTKEDQKFKPKPSRKRPYNANAAPQMRKQRRTPIPWTDDEVEMLKEGMKRFKPRNNKPIPWKDILEFGCSVFSKSRTTVDLKDKWRNLSGKAESKQVPFAP